jgi:hypothetical protein
LQLSALALQLKPPAKHVPEIAHWSALAQPASVDSHCPLLASPQRPQVRHSLEPAQPSAVLAQKLPAKPHTPSLLQASLWAQPSAVGTQAAEPAAQNPRWAQDGALAQPASVGTQLLPSKPQKPSRHAWAQPASVATQPSAPSPHKPSRAQSVVARQCASETHSAREPRAGDVPSEKHIGSAAVQASSIQWLPHGLSAQR